MNEIYLDLIFSNSDISEGNDILFQCRFYKVDIISLQVEYY